MTIMRHSTVVALVREIVATRLMAEALRLRLWAHHIAPDHARKLERVAEQVGAEVDARRSRLERAATKLDNEDQRHDA